METIKRDGAYVSISEFDHPDTGKRTQFESTVTISSTLAGAIPCLWHVALGPLRRFLRAVSVIARLGPRKFEKLYVDEADVLDRRHMGRRSRHRRGLPPRLFLDAWGARQRWRSERGRSEVLGCRSGDSPRVHS